MIQKEGDIKSRVAEPGYFAIEDHHALRADQDVLGAKVAVDQTKRSGSQPISFLSEERLQRRMALAGAQQIGFDSQLKKLGSGGETGTNFRVVPGMAMYGGENGRGLFRMVDFRFAGH